MISVYVIDDHAVVRAGFASLLEAETDITVIGEAACGEDAFSDYVELQADVLITDISMPGEGGFAFMRRLLARHADAKLLIMSMFDDAIFVKRAMQYGAMGYISKSDDPNLLIQAVRAIAAGETWVAPQLAQKLIGSIRGGKAHPLEALTAKEFEVFVLLAQGKDSKQVAGLLHMSPKTAGTHQTRIFHKLNIHTSAELAHLAIRMDVLNK